MASAESSSSIVVGSGFTNTNASTSLSSADIARSSPQATTASASSQSATGGASGGGLGTTTTTTGGVSGGLGTSLNSLSNATGLSPLALLSSMQAAQRAGHFNSTGALKPGGLPPGLLAGLAAAGSGGNNSDQPNKLALQVSL